MRQEISENEINDVVGGAVCISEKRKRISFSTLGEGYPLKCSYRDANTYVATLFAQHPEMGEQEFDEFVKQAFQNKGWI